MYYVVDTRTLESVYESEFLDDVEDYIADLGDDGFWFRVDFESLDD